MCGIRGLCHPENPLQVGSADCMAVLSHYSINLLQIENNSVADTLASLEAIYDTVVLSR